MLFHAFPEAQLVPTSLALYFWDVSEDGERFVLASPDMQNSPEPFTVILNWTSLLKK